MKNIPDQSELRASIEVFDLQARYLRALVETKTGEKVPAPQLSADDEVLNFETMEAHVNELQRKLSAASQQPAQATQPAQTQPAPRSETSKPTAKKQTSDQQIAIALAPKREREQRQAALQKELWPQYKAGTLTMDEMCRRVNAVK